MVECVSDFKMPEKIVTRLLKDSLPENVSISKDAKNAACRSASVFILQLSIAAAEKAQQENRDTLDNQDIIKAVMDLGLGDYASQLVRFGAQRKRNAKRKEGTVTPKGKQTKTISADDTQSQDNMDHIDQESCDMQTDQAFDYLDEVHENHDENHDEETRDEGPENHDDQEESESVN